MVLSTEWADLFAINPTFEPISYKALDNLTLKPTLAFLHQLFWDKIRAWTQNDTTQMSPIAHPDLRGPGRVYIGGMNHALNESVLAEHNITAVVTIHPKDSLAWDEHDALRGLRRFGPGGGSVVEHPLIVPLEDNANSNLIDWFPQTSKFIGTHAAAGRNILIHCKSGRSRSVAVLIAYLQREFASQLLPSSADGDAEDVMREQLAAYRASVTESIRAQRLPVLVIMERFQDLLALYDLQLIGHPSLETERGRLFPEREVPAHRMVPTRVDSLLKEDPAPAAPRTGLGGKKVVTKGGAAVLKICVAWVFFARGQRPTEAVVHQFFEINEAYFYELEGLEYKGRDYRGCKHMCPGLVGFCLRFANEYGLVLPDKTEEHAVIASKERV
ncbi:putative tyrosine-protein phosphatase [Colletotrichum sidae]|uniref:protein-tyrosine-phosphatase n=1 Tax=Colletotrichum sidae TaxID=1347389 RepID=A0A4R8TPM9_9PEZI|nr:putative tyrosine-protein phosphatase [Colletotrichum sidae]